MGGVGAGFGMGAEDDDDDDGGCVIRERGTGWDGFKERMGSPVNFDATTYDQLSGTWDARHVLASSLVMITRLGCYLPMNSYVSYIQSLRSYLRVPRQPRCRTAPLRLKFPSHFQPFPSSQSLTVQRSPLLITCRPRSGL